MLIGIRLCHIGDDQMYKVACRELGMDCKAVITGQSVEEVKKKAMAHAQDVHRDILSKMTPMQMTDMDRTLNSKIISS
jgi:predicted small metal-binding protein